MRAWQDATRLGFGMADASDDALTHWVRDISAIDMRLDAAYATSALPGVTAEWDAPVGTFGSACLSINAPEPHRCLLSTCLTSRCGPRIGAGACSSGS